VRKAEKSGCAAATCNKINDYSINYDFNLADMEIELKNVQEYKKLSEETMAYSATLYINGKRAGEVRNDGRGGMTKITPYDQNGHQLIEQAKEHSLNLLDPNNEHFGKGRAFPYTLDMYIDHLADKMLDEADLKKLITKMELLTPNHVVMEIKKGEYKATKLKWPMEEILNTPSKKNGLAKLLVRMQQELPIGSVLLNKNIPAEIVPDRFKVYVSKKKGKQQQTKPQGENKKRPKK
jgi:hypothetical protein